jgi:hypothetical protein
MRASKEMTMKPQTILAIASLAIAIGATPALAHHAVNSQFDVTKNLELTGVLTKVELINPHTYVYFDVKNKAGKFETWNIESGAPGALRRAGLSARDSLVPGATYKFVISPARNGSKSGLMSGLTLPDGRFFAFGALGNVEAAKELSGH